MAHQNLWLTTNAVAELTPPAVWSGPLAAQGLSPGHGHLSAHAVIAGPRSRVRHRLQGHELVTCHRLTLREACAPWGTAHRDVCGLDNRPAEIFRAVFGVALALNLAMTAPLTLHAAAVGGQGPRAREARHGPRFQPDGPREHIPHPRHRCEPVPLGRGAHVAHHPPREALDGRVAATEETQVTRDGQDGVDRSELTGQVVLAERSNLVRPPSMARVAGKQRWAREPLRHVLPHQLGTCPEQITHGALVLGIENAFRSDVEAQPMGQPARIDLSVANLEPLLLVDGRRMGEVHAIAGLATAIDEPVPGVR